MPREHKDLKRLVRARMEKTGESYTAARAVLVDRGNNKTAPTPLPSAAPRESWPDLAGMSDDAVRAKTQRSWSQWVALLDEAGAYEQSHRDIARHVGNSYPELGGWWAQTVTVGYERIRGLRDVGQRRGGSYDANKSRTYPVDVSTLYKMFSEKRRRERWLPEGFARIRVSRVDTSMRVDWHDSTQVNLHFTAKSNDKSSVSVQHVKLADREAVDAAKDAWHGRLDALRDALR